MILLETGMAMKRTLALLAVLLLTLGLTACGGGSEEGGETEGTATPSGTTPSSARAKPWTPPPRRPQRRSRITAAASAGNGRQP
jgi:ABC-type glycerol-3-phosphate transport system substrate-binding protein